MQFFFAGSLLSTFINVRKKIYVRVLNFGVKIEKNQILGFFCLKMYKK